MTVAFRRVAAGNKEQIGEIYLFQLLNCGIGGTLGNPKE